MSFETFITYSNTFRAQDTKQFDGWSLKKSIINTLLQAVKAIAGGVTTLQGQLIKGSGYLVQQKGKVRIVSLSVRRECNFSLLLTAHSRWR